MKGILFNQEMVRAILDGRKSVTRRVVKPQMGEWCFNCLEENPTMTRCRESGEEYVTEEKGLWACFEWDGFPEFPLVKAPYRPGDILYVRETWNRRPFNYDEFIYKADGCYGPDMPWRPSIHMPKEAARLFLRVTDVRVERLQDITELQILESEGVQVDFPQPRPSCLSLAYAETRLKPAVRAAFSTMWDSTIKKADIPRYGWEASPWVWVIEFERIRKEEAQP